MKLKQSRRAFLHAAALSLTASLLSLLPWRRTGAGSAGSSPASRYARLSCTWSISSESQGYSTS